MALATALRNGALESAERLLRQLLARPDEVEWAGPSGQAVVVEALLMLGERDTAREMAERYQRDLATTTAGMSVLELLGVAGSKDWLPDGRPNVLRLSRSVAAGELGFGDLAQLVEPRLWSFLSSPELHLLFFNALIERDGAAAARFLNRFLRLHGPEQCCVRPAPEAPRVLETLRFNGLASVRTGPLVSVLVAARNAADTIGYAIDSLLGQSYKNLEVLVGDDDSTDGTLEIARRRAGDTRVRLFRSSANQGAYNVRNALAQHSRGALLTFHDADDLALPGRIARQVERIESPDVVGCVANLLRISPSGAFVFHRDQRASRLCPVSLMIKREAFQAVAPFRSARVGADLELYAKLSARFGAPSVVRIKSPLILGLWSPRSATRASGSESLEDGYRSSARRSYSELVFAQHSSDGRRPTELEIDERLRASNNFVAPSTLSEVK